MKELTEKEFNQIRSYIKTNFGISLGNEKKSLIYSRLRSTLIELGLDSFTQYYEYLVNDQSGQAVKRFIDKVTTNHTFFMREVDHFDYFRDVVLPYIDKDFSAQKDLRVWCAGCSSGEEAYTLQMIIQDYFKKASSGWDTSMLATDISSNVLSKAVAGVYSNDSIDSLPGHWTSTYFRKFDDAHSVVVDSLKQNIIFRKFNLMEETFPFKKKFQAIFCRNVMIYFDSSTRNKLVEKFFEWTEPGGYLFIGHSESLTNTDSKYKYVKPAIYRKV